MTRLSRTELAKRFLSLLEQHERQDAVAALAHLLVEQGRSHETDIIIQEIGQVLLKRNKHLEISVTSAHPVSPGVAETIADLFKQKTGAKSTHVSFYTNPKLLGGIIARALDYEIDLSVKHKLRQLEA